jgi:hypothetical protein
MRKKTKPKTELCSTLDRNRKLTLILGHGQNTSQLLNVQTDCEGTADNNYTTDNSNIPDKIEVNVRFANSSEANEK